jgi:hypothetical protein
MRLTHSEIKQKEITLRALFSYENLKILVKTLIFGRFWQNIHKQTQNNIM